MFLAAIIFILAIGVTSVVWLPFLIPIKLGIIIGGIISLSYIVIIFRVIEAYKDAKNKYKE